MAADRISELPDHIVSHILSFLPTKLAATTSILSKRWKSVWHSVLTLDFDDQTFKDFDSLTNFMISTMSSRDIKLPIHSFTFKCVNESSPYDLKVLNLCAILAVQYGKLENLSLHMPLHSIVKGLRNPNVIHLSPYIFSCKTLQVLHLNCLILEDISFQPLDLPLLKTLRWEFVLFKNINHVIELLSSCPILEEFVLCVCVMSGGRVRTS
ncbi:F-box/FBD/LRR-repeat protein At4g00160-like [Trifolium pratense]|uniref:F-box/FBD/LRR-repeat protein At4g00160-like n=1 Tax=Trifolium pratense TaxID=57577 RepID=UPI001E691347|nr:F-box/FBD/LRR-repeat protein At4g00160-like [Trifolium pratense]